MLTLIDFYADWCGPCKMMSPVLEKLEKTYSAKVEFKKVDVEADGAMSAKFGIQSIPTFVLVKDDKEIDRRMGAAPEEVMKQWINSHL
ncbi:thioredoxin [candidate division WWE3 bacterium RIFOXYC1_FULL_40_10]|uniref:Thioredoxin n=1 Tax=candidate division WWE3 bacterium RIFOXYA2_FULL_46_9 TaxID=1802636 RepID=A0A1F4W0S3_UNCKA|nr:MAG: thioredoxin [candidate division WWE3 bacterium RIFOXYB1_FULL_40_22]OGC62033.1 MAG: thioredoxin [candidate division WWE3 bacterium RIFOXYA1_FULL_40_11]OGC62950.1 MAG: thioredoxin [candidate division WWE3 bacterium RIFOXYA2_FULL_46_9]OGC65023.1 MAG: thioredoxin [candidate division WWE3 bacterium RIFOXYB2_FULL_41_6]OGC66416.1 MAG: thioredoxin [candidate division WWE3 bacterium RIFOXYC1_FULL_40_10]OGC68017.1 MAG: thioredoxin [candidate division WWE3 bacterium RIFOXYC2_FULL_40_11]HLD51575.